MKMHAICNGVAFGADWVQRYFNVTQSCARAAQLRLEKTQAEVAAR